MRRQWQRDAPVVVHGTVMNHFLKGPLHEVNIFLLLEKKNKTKQKGKNPLSLAASALGGRQLIHTEMFTEGLVILDRHRSPVQDRLQEIHTMECHATH